MTLEDEVNELVEIAHRIERPEQLVGVAQFEITNLYLPQLKGVLGEGLAYNRLLAMGVRIGEELTQSENRIKDMRMAVLQIAEAIQRGMS